MKLFRTLLLVALLPLAGLVRAQAPNVIYSYAIGDWRNGPVVVISPLFETTEAFTTPQLIARVKRDYPAFKDITDIDIQRFATVEEGEESRRILKAKYGVRKLEVNMLEEPAKEKGEVPAHQE
ncbi:MAG TPA: hypothetical protein VGE21_13880 [Flavobacteriales bacterium]